MLLCGLLALLQLRRRRMLPSEMVILMAIEVARNSSKKLLYPSGVTVGYVTGLYDSLVQRGYLRKGSLRGYQLTSEGRESLFEFLLENRTRVKEMTEALRQLGVEASEEIDRLAREVLQVK